MLELASLLSAYLSFGLLYCSRTERSRRQRLSPQERRDKQLFRAAALLALACAWGLWSWHQGSESAWLVVPVAYMLSALLQVIGSEFWPQAMNKLNIVCPSAAGVLVALEVFGG